MKKLLILLVLVIVGIFGYGWYKVKAPQTEVEVAPSTSRPDPSNAAFIIEGSPVKLDRGNASITISGDIIPTEVSIAGETVYGDLNGDKKNDAALLLVQESGGSGVFVYIAAYVSGNVTYKGTNAVFVGDRISPESMSISKDGILTLKYLDRGENEPMAATPTLEKSKEYLLRGSTLEER